MALTIVVHPLCTGGGARFRLARPRLHGHHGQNSCRILEADTHILDLTGLRQTRQCFTRSGLRAYSRKGTRHKNSMRSDAHTKIGGEKTKTKRQREQAVSHVPVRSRLFFKTARSQDCRVKSPLFFLPVTKKSVFYVVNGMETSRIIGEILRPPKFASTPDSPRNLLEAIMLRSNPYAFFVYGCTIRGCGSRRAAANHGR